MMLKLNLTKIYGVAEACNPKSKRDFAGVVYVYDDDDKRVYVSCSEYMIFEWKDNLSKDEQRLEQPLLLLPSKIKIGKGDEMCEMEYIDTDPFHIVITYKGQKYIFENRAYINYPDYKKLIPDDTTPMATEFALFSWEVSKKLEKFLGCFYPKRPQQLMSNDKCRWNAPNKIAVAMPMRVD